MKEDEEEAKLLEEINESSSSIFSRPALIKGHFSIFVFIYKFFIKTTISKGAAKILDATLPVISRSYILDKGYKKVVIEKWKRVGGDIKDAAMSLSRLTR